MNSTHNAPAATAAAEASRQRQIVRLLVACAQRIVHERRLHPKGVWQLHAGKEMLAWVDWAGRHLAIRSGTRSDTLRAASAVWSARPDAAANQQSPGFEQHALDEALWLLSQSSADLHLPDTLRAQPLSLKRLPRVRLRWFKDRQLALLEHLMQSPANLAELSQVFPETGGHLEADLVGLYWCKAIGTPGAASGFSR